LAGIGGQGTWQWFAILQAQQTVVVKGCLREELEADAASPAHFTPLFTYQFWVEMVVLCSEDGRPTAFFPALEFEKPLEQMSLTWLDYRPKFGGGLAGGYKINRT
jgi:hypothetical protein